MANLPDELTFYRKDEFPDLHDMTDEEWQAYWQYMCQASHDWAHSVLRPKCEEHDWEETDSGTWVCFDCDDEKRSGWILEDRVVCLECANDGSPVTPDSHPDGFTCADCGRVEA